MALKFTPFPILETDRLVLRKITEDDAEAVLKLRSDAMVNKYISRPLALNIDDAKAWIARISKFIAEDASVNWAMTLKGTGDLIGLICFWNLSEDGTVAETGYELYPQYQGMGFMTEALNAVLAYGFGSFQFGVVEAYTHRENAASRRLLEKAGFIVNPSKTDDGFPDNVIYQLSADNA